MKRPDIDGIRRDACFSHGVGRDTLHILIDYIDFLEGESLRLRGRLERIEFEAIKQAGQYDEYRNAVTVMINSMHEAMRPLHTLLVKREESK